jgi:hypothetical protein
MHAPALLEGERKSCVIWYERFRQSPALIVYLDKSVAEAEQLVRPALVPTLFLYGTLSLDGAVRLSGMVR